MRENRKFIPIMSDRAVQEIKVHMNDNNMSPFSEPREELEQYFSAQDIRWYYYNPMIGYGHGEDDVIMWKYVIRQWAIEVD